MRNGRGPGTGNFCFTCGPLTLFKSCRVNQPQPGTWKHRPLSSTLSYQARLRGARTQTGGFQNLARCAQWPRFYQEPTAAWGPGSGTVGLRVPRGQACYPQAGPPPLPHSKPRTPLLEPRQRQEPRAQATHLSGPGGSGYTPPPHSLGWSRRETVRGTDKAGSHPRGLRRGCHRNLASSAHRMGPRCGGHTGRSLKGKTSTCLLRPEPSTLQRQRRAPGGGGHSAEPAARVGAPPRWKQHGPGVESPPQVHVHRVNLDKPSDTPCLSASPAEWAPQPQVGSDLKGFL